MQVIWDYPVLVAVNGFGEGAVVMSWALEKWVVRLCWLKNGKGPSGCGGWKRGGPGKNGRRASRRKKRREPAGLVWKFGPWPI
jgi:hypothetical protein